MGAAAVRRRAEEPRDDAALAARFVEERRGLADDELRGEYGASGEAFAEMLRGLPAAALADGAPGAVWATRLADHALDHAAVFGDIGA